jgi:hypothetical protein
MNQKISGLYEEIFPNSSERKTKRTKLELRVDVDGARPLNVISGDFYSNSKGKRNYLSSFIFQEIKKKEIPTKGIRLIGKKGQFSLNSDQIIDIQITTHANSHPLRATAKWTNNSGSESKCLIKCASKYFRRVRLEHDYEKGVLPLEPYETTALSSPSSHRSYPIGIIDAFAEAGIEIIVVKEKRDSVPSPKGNPEDGAVWTDNELQAAMLKHFTAFNQPQWTLWLLSAKEYVMSNIYGITVDCKEKKRRGCAVFQSSTGWESVEEKRFRLFIYVHELGHCFNLHHPWEKPQDDPSPEAGRYATLSWMNLPWRYYSSEEARGEKAFWEAFDFQFSNSELTHLRHGFRNDVIFGGNAFNRENDRKFADKGATKSVA